MKEIKLLLFVVCAITFASCTKNGCTDSSALNFSSEAKNDDGSCFYTPANKYGALSWKITSLLENESFNYNSKFKINDSIYVQFTLCQMYLSNPMLIGYGSVSTDTSFTDNFILLKTDVRNYDIGKAKEGTYSGFQLHFGIDSATNNTKKPNEFLTNHALSAQNPSMYSDSLNQYYFVKLEGLYDSDFDSIPDAIFEYNIGADNYLILVNTYTRVSVLINKNKNEVLEMKINWSAFLKNVDVLSRPNTSVPDSISNKIVSNLGNVFMN